MPHFAAPCVVPHVSHGFVRDRASGASVPHSQTIDVQCLSQFQKTHNSTPVCKNGTWSRIPKCVPGKLLKTQFHRFVLVHSVWFIWDKLKGRISKYEDIMVLLLFLSSCAN